MGSSLVNKILSRSVCRCQPNALQNIIMSGSISEGATTSRFFKYNNNFDDGINRELEFDIEFTLVEIKSDFKHYVEDIPEKHGYVRVLADANMLIDANAGWDITDEGFKELLQNFSKNGYIQPFKLKNLTLQKALLDNDVENQKYLEILFAAAYNEKISDISIKKAERVTNASAAFEFYFQVKEKNMLVAAYDLVPLAQIFWWPDIALEWKHRKRNWPDKQFIDDLTKTCFIIAKPLVIEKGDEESYSWRYSFSHIERKLISMRTPQQNLIYLIFKSIFYKWIKPINATQIHSFIAKNIMLKACEEFPPDHQMWIESCYATKEAILYLLLQTQKAFENEYLAYFFINKIDVIEYIEPAVKEDVKLKILLISKDIDKYIPSNVTQVIAVCDDLLEKLKNLDNILANTNSNNYSDFINLKFLVQNLDFLFDEPALNLYKELLEKYDVKNKAIKEVERFKDIFKNEITNFTERLDTDEVSRVQNELRRFTERIENEVERAKNCVLKFLR